MRNKTVVKRRATRRRVRGDEYLRKMVKDVERLSEAVNMLASEDLSVDQLGGTYDPYFDAVVLSCRAYVGSADMKKKRDR